ncbi:uncharacterized protein LOC141639779 [Silene latifolia]|uniref:uncharacterized protein LOC141639779 n=1 Tax=Silene latifolia TaxID=37657 RepID=UPI003D780FB6
MTKEIQQKVIQQGYVMFDNKPVIIREWTPSTNLVKEKLDKLPIWVNMVGLNLKFWGKECLHKLGGLIGTVIRRDEATEKKMFQGFARLMIEVQVNQQFPESLSFLDEEGEERKATPKVGVIGDKRGISPAQTASRLSRQDTHHPPITPGGHSYVEAVKLSQRKGRETVELNQDKGSSNKQEVQSRVYSRIDRVLINDDWLNMHPESFANFLPEGIYDHCPCVIQLDSNDRVRNVPFRYFNMWAKSPGFLEIVNQHWNVSMYGTHMYKLVTRMKVMKKDLKDLNRDNFHDVEKNAHIMQMTLQNIQKELQASPHDAELVEAEKSAATGFKVLDEAKYLYLAQKAKVSWLEEGDENTAFFHSAIRNVECSVKKVHYPTVRQGNILTVEHHRCLARPVTGEEVRQVIFSIPSNKSPGPDGFNSQFFKDTWGVIGADVVAVVQGFSSSGKLLKQINNTSLTLIPKVDMPKNVNQFRPIACCNTIYKCIAKILCNRLSEVLPAIISPTQSAFIKDRDIVENILICQDITKLYNRKHCSPRVIMKLDLQKAYDSIEWSFLEDMLKALNFPTHFLNMLMECVTTPHFSLSLNGEQFGYFKGRRGLRQGDPLSPLLFTVCMEYLSRVLNRVKDIPGFKHHPLCRKINLTHLWFADNLLVFCRGDWDSMTVIMRAFNTFSAASGLQMNKHKSNIYGNSLPRELLEKFAQLSGLKIGKLPFKYLGVGDIIPTWIMAKIKSTCMSFLWKGETSTESPALVAWDKGSSWACRRICRVKDRLLVRYVGNDWLSVEGVYTIAAGYQWLGIDCPAVDWYHCIWNSSAIPKHQFIGWLWVQGRLLTKDRLFRMHIRVDKTCDLCGVTEESHEHLFFECVYSQLCLQQVNGWSHGNITQANQLEWWREHRTTGKLDVYVAIFLALVHHIWWARNNCRVNQVVLTPEVICQRVKFDVTVKQKQVCKGSYRRLLEEFLS